LRKDKFLVNNNFMRQGQGNRQRNRGNRNRHRSGGNGGGSGSGSGGNPANRVYDSNGPDVKVRGTSQTVAEKYMQLGRDAQSSGDNVAAESYYQHAEHYYRIWAANQPQGASLQMARKFGDDEFEEETAEDGGEDETPEAHAGEAPVNGEVTANPEQPATAGGGNGDGQRPFNNSQRGNNRERFRPRWQRNRERFNQDGSPEQPANVANAESQATAETEASGQWEAPSFLRQPMPQAGAEADATPPRRGRPRREREEAPEAAEDGGPSSK
jgi:Domain of unknown function (DUF4167)